MTIDLGALEKLADEATPGPWETDAGDGPLDGCAKFRSHAEVLVYAEADCDIHPVADTSCNHSCRTDEDQAANAAFIAAANPATIKALIAELREARGLLAEAKSYFAPDQDAVAMLVRVDAFLARNGKSDLQKMQNSARNGKGEG